MEPLRASYTATYGLVFDRFSAGAEYMDRFFTLIQYVAQMFQWTQTLQGHAEKAEKAGHVANSADLSRFFISLGKAVLIWESFVSLKMFYERYSAADIQQAHEQNTWQYFMVEGAFKKVSTSGNFVAPNGEGNYVARDWMDVAMGIIVFFARTITCVNWMHSFKIIDLGKASKHTGVLVIAAWAAVLTLGLVQAVRDLCKEENSTLLHKRNWDTASASLDCCFLIVDANLIGKNALAKSIGAFICVGSTGAFFAKSLIYYR